MAGVTDWAYRCIAAQLGADITMTEMVSSRALVYKDKKSLSLLRKTDAGICGAQIFGNDPSVMADGAALALAASNGLAFLYRSITGQMYYRTVASYPKTISGFLLAFAVTAIGTLLWQHFFIKFALVGVILFIYCTLYRAQLARLWSMGLGILRGIFHRK